VSRKTPGGFRWGHMSNPYDDRGYLFPVAALSEPAAERFRSCFLAYRASIADRLTTLPAKDQYLVFSETHLFLPWVYEMITQPAVLDAVEEVLGPNLIIWNTRWFTKMPGDKTYI
jgi:non-haem Fe2+, alpha-ketoglutarate-dependent halogenase